MISCWRGSRWGNFQPAVFRRATSPGINTSELLTALGRLASQWLSDEGCERSVFSFRRRLLITSLASHVTPKLATSMIKAGSRQASVEPCKKPKRLQRRYIPNSRTFQRMLYDVMPQKMHFETWGRGALHTSSQRSHSLARSAKKR